MTKQQLRLENPLTRCISHESQRLQNKECNSRFAVDGFCWICLGQHRLFG